MKEKYLIVLCLLFAYFNSAGMSADSLIILANEREPRSLEFARFYADKRNVPVENILVLPMPLKEVITWDEFVSQLYNPLLKELIERGWVSAIPTGSVDSMGRDNYRVLSHRIGAILSCKGVPLKIKNSPNLIKEGEVDAFRKQNRFLRSMADVEASLKYYNVNYAAVDSELALLSMNDAKSIAFVDNPVFAKRDPSIMDLQKIIYVSRIDGPRWELLESMVNDALFVEKYGLSGRAYLDIGGPFHSGDRWLENVAVDLPQSGLDYDIDRNRSTLSKYSRFDAPVLYFGWYKSDIEGPFTVDGFSFQRGAIAVHLHSFSASSITNTSRNWVGPFLDKGVTATLGNVNEPTLFFCHHFDIFYKSLFEGKTFVEAAYSALPALSWQGLAIGDPLYRPFACKAVDIEESLLYRPYTVLAKAKGLFVEGKKELAYTELKLAWEKRPDLSYALFLAELHLEFSRKDLAIDILRYFEYAPVRPTEYGLLLEMASLSSSLSSYDVSFALYSRVMKDPRVDSTFKLSLVQRIAPVAQKTGNQAWLEVWKKAFQAKL